MFQTDCSWILQCLLWFWLQLYSTYCLSSEPRWPLNYMGLFPSWALDRFKLQNNECIINCKQMSDLNFQIPDNMVEILRIFRHWNMISSHCLGVQIYKYFGFNLSEDRFANYLVRCLGIRIAYALVSIWFNTTFILCECV